MDLRRDAPQIRREVGYMTQRFGLYEDLSIRENLEFIARLYELPNRRDAVDRTLDRLGLTSRHVRSSSPARCRAVGSNAWHWPPV